MHVANDRRRAPSSRPARVATLCATGRPVTQARRNEQRYELLLAAVRQIRARPDWGDLDALLLPAGYFLFPGWLGPLPASVREELLSETEFADVCKVAARRLARMSPGCLVIAGVDSPNPTRRVRGDQLVVAFSQHCVMGSARKLFPVNHDTTGHGRPPYLLFADDYDDPRRFVGLANGQVAALSVCYDAFVFAELAIGPTAKRGAMRLLGTGGTGRIRLDRGEADRLLERFAARLRKSGPTLNLVAIHGFERPGGEVLWQRHGLATASAALDGALTIGAAHFFDWLPWIEGQSPLAAIKTSKSELFASCHRRAHGHVEIDRFDVAVGRPSRLKGLVRLYQAS